MARGKRSGARTGDLFIDASGQMRLVNKSAEQSAMEDSRVECLGMTFENDSARRAHYIAKLREKLNDPAFRSIEGFPVGEDEDILALSDPPYFTACPNPFLEDLFRLHGKPAEDGNGYTRQPFAVDTIGGKNDPIYNAHAYHTKSPWPVIAQYVEHFTVPGDIVLDAFAGAGMTGAAVQSVGGGRHAVLAELSPIASFIGANTAGPRNAERVRSRAAAVIRGLEARHAWMFSTRHCGWDSGIRDHREVTNGPTLGTGVVHFTLWSDVYRCPECGRELVYWSHAVDYENECLRETFPCPECNAQLRKDGLDRVLESVWDPLLKIQRTRGRQVPVLINYAVGTSRYEKFPDADDLALIQRIELLTPSSSAPVVKMMFRDPPWGEMYRAGYHAGMTHAHHFYWWRSLIVLADACEAIGDDRELRYWFTSTLPWCNRENRLSVGNYFGKKGGVITTYRGAIYIASLGVETNPIERLRHRLDSALIDLPPRDADTFITTQSSATLPAIPDNCVDYVFIDPPFGGNLIYSELNFLWESWLRVWTSNKPEVIISAFEKKDLASYEAGIRRVLHELYRVLKPNRWITVQFHNSQNAVWIAIQTALFEAGFVVADVRMMDKGKASFKQVVAAGAVKKDLVISAYKPARALEERVRLERGHRDLAWEFVRSHLRYLPVFVASNDRQAEITVERQSHMLYDRMVAFYVQRGVAVPASSGDFYMGLSQRFPERDGMYFLPEQVPEYDRRRAAVEDVQQLSLMVTDEASAIQWVRQELLRKPQTFQEIQPEFMRESQTWSRHEMRLELRTLLEESFLRYDGDGPVPSQIHGYLSTNFKDLRNMDKAAPRLREKAKERWYVPDPNKQGDLEKLRERTLLREFEEYRAAKQKRLKVFRTEAIRAGFRALWSARDYEAIVAVAQKLPEGVVQEDQTILMYFDNASMRIQT